MASQLREGDRPTFRATITRPDGTPIDLTNSTAHMVFRFDEGLGTEVQASIDDAPNGKVSYEMGAGELLSGLMKREWFAREIATGKENGGGEIFTSDVRPKFVLAP